MIVLRRESDGKNNQHVSSSSNVPEDAQSAALESFCHILVIWTKQSAHSELSSFDPNARRLMHSLKCHHPAIGAADHTTRILWFRDGSSAGLEFTVEELVKCFERVDGISYLIYIKAMESDEGGDVNRTRRGVVFETLLDGQRFEKLPC